MVLLERATSASEDISATSASEDISATSASEDITRCPTTLYPIVLMSAMAHYFAI